MPVNLNKQHRVEGRSDATIQNELLMRRVGEHIIVDRKHMLRLTALE